MCSVPFQISYFRKYHGCVPRTLTSNSNIRYIGFVVPMLEIKVIYQSIEMPTLDPYRDPFPHKYYDQFTSHVSFHPPSPNEFLNMVLPFNESILKATTNIKGRDIICIISYFLSRLDQLEVG